MSSINQAVTYQASVILPKWIDDKKGSDPLVDDLIAYIEQNAAPQVVADEQAAFEVAVLDAGFSPDAIKHDEKGIYYQMDVRMMRKGWTACRAALAAAPVQPSNPVEFDGIKTAPVQPVAVPHGWRDAALESAVQAVAERAGESEKIDVINAFDAIRSLKKNRHALPESCSSFAAPAAQGDAKDTERLRWLVETGARISWSVDGEYCAVWLPDECDGTESRPAEGYPLKCYDNWHRAIDAAITADKEDT